MFVTVLRDVNEESGIAQPTVITVPWKMFCPSFPEIIEFLPSSFTRD
jgi:hypothetical protein